MKSGNSEHIEGLLTNFTGYSAVVNHLDFTSVAFPVTFVDQSVDVRATQHKIRNEENARIQASCEQISFFCSC